MLGSDQSGAAFPTCATWDEAFEPAASPWAHAASGAMKAIARLAIPLSIARIADRPKVELHLLDEFAHFAKKPLFAQEAQLAQAQLASVDRLRKVAQPGLDRTFAAAELRIRTDRNECRIIAPVIPRDRGVDAVLREQLCRNAKICRGEAERVSTSRPDLHGAANLIADTPEQTVGLRELAALDERANPRARDPFAALGNRLDRNEPHAARGEHLTHEPHVAGSPVSESERRADDHPANAEPPDQYLEKCLGRERRDAVVELDKKALFKSRPGKELEALLRRAEQARLRSRPQVRCGMICKGEQSGAPSRPPEQQRLTGEFAVAAMEAVEEADRQHQRAITVAREFVTNDHSTKTLRGASSAPSASPTPTSVRDASRTKTCRPVAPSGSGTTLPARKSADSRRSSTIVGKGMICSGAISASTGSRAISSSVRAS